MTSGHFSLQNQIEMIKHNPTVNANSNKNPTKKVEYFVPLPLEFRPCMSRYGVWTYIWARSIRRKIIGLSFHFQVIGGGSGFDYMLRIQL